MHSVVRFPRRLRGCQRCGEDERDDHEASGDDRGNGKKLVSVAESDLINQRDVVH